LIKFRVAIDDSKTIATLQAVKSLDKPLGKAYIHTCRNGGEWEER